MPHPLTEEQARAKQNRRQAQVGLASNVLGLTAGTAGLAAAAKNPSLRERSKKVGEEFNAPPKVPKEVGGPVTGRIAGKLKNVSPRTKGRLIRAGAAGAVGLQAANIGGDVVANRVLARSAAEPEQKVKKNMSDLAELGEIAKYQDDQKRTGGRTAAALGAGLTAGGIGSAGWGGQKYLKTAGEAARRHGEDIEDFSTRPLKEQKSLGRSVGQKVKGLKRAKGGGIATAAGLGTLAASPVIGGVNMARNANQRKKAASAFPQ